MLFFQSLVSKHWLRLSYEISAIHRQHGATPEGVYRHMLTKTPEMLTVHPEGILTTCTVILLPRSCPVAGDVHRSHLLNAWILSFYQSEERTKPTVRE